MANIVEVSPLPQGRLFDQTKVLIQPAITLDSKFTTGLSGAVLGSNWRLFPLPYDDMGKLRTEIGWAEVDMAHEAVQTTIKSRPQSSQALRNQANMDATQLGLSDSGFNFIRPLAVVNLPVSNFDLKPTSCLEICFYQPDVRALECLTPEELRPLLGLLGRLSVAFEDSGIVHGDFKVRNISLRKSAISSTAPQPSDLFIFDLENAFVHPEVARTLKLPVGLLWDSGEQYFYDVADLARGLVNKEVSERAVMDEFVQVFIEERLKNDRPWKIDLTGEGLRQSILAKMYGFVKAA